MSAKGKRSTRERGTEKRIAALERQVEALQGVALELGRAIMRVGRTIAVTTRSKRRNT